MALFPRLLLLLACALVQARASSRANLRLRLREDVSHLSARKLADQHRLGTGSSQSIARSSSSSSSGVIRPIVLPGNPLAQNLPPSASTAATAGSRGFHAGIHRLSPSQGQQRLTSSTGSWKSAAVTSNKYYLWPGLRGPSTTGLDAPLYCKAGGRVLSSPINVYLIYYGAWSWDSMGYPLSGQDVHQSFVKSISDSSADASGRSVRKWWAINTRYQTPAKTNVSRVVNLASVVSFSGPYNKTLTDIYNAPKGKPDSIQTLVVWVIQQLRIKVTSSDVYLVLTSADISIGSASNGFCSGYCGWHYAATYGAITFQYALVGDHQNCLQGCSPYYSYLDIPLQNTLAESMVSAIGHELAEAASNPSWTTRGCTNDDSENGDMCNGEYLGLQYDASTSKLFNLYGINKYTFMVQALPDIATQQCDMQ